MSTRKVVESFPDIPRSYTRRVGDWVQEGGNNSIIVLGTDRADFGPADVDVGLGTTEADGNGKGTGCALISVGRKDQDGNPDFDIDDSFIYLAMKTEVDKNMGIDDVAKPQEVEFDVGAAPAILAKSDHIRAVFRGTLKIVLENEERNDYIYINKDKTIVSQNEGVFVVMDKDTITVECSENSVVINRGDGTINITSKSKVNVYTKTAYVEADDVAVKATKSVKVDCTTATVNATSKLDVTSPMSTFNGNMTVVGTVSCGPISAPSISTGGPAGFPPGQSTMKGPLVVENEVTGNGKNLSTHTHLLLANAKAGPDVLGTKPTT